MGLERDLSRLLRSQHSALGIDPNPRPVGVLLQGLPVALRIDPRRYQALHVSPSCAPPLF